MQREYGWLTRKAVGPAVDGFEKRDDSAKANAADEHMYIQSIMRTFVRNSEREGGVIDQTHKKIMS